MENNENKELEEFDSSTIETEAETENLDANEVNEQTSDFDAGQLPAEQEFAYSGKTGFSNLKDWLVEKLSFVPAIIYSGIALLVSDWGFIYFGRLKNNYPDDISMRNSFFLLQIFSIIVFVIFICVFIASIVLNSKRKKQDKR